MYIATHLVLSFFFFWLNRKHERGLREHYFLPLCVLHRVSRASLSRCIIYWLNNIQYNSYRLLKSTLQWLRGSIPSTFTFGAHFDSNCICVLSFPLPCVAWLALLSNSLLKFFSSSDYFADCIIHPLPVSFETHHRLDHVYIFTKGSMSW